MQSNVLYHALKKRIISLTRGKYRSISVDYNPEDGRGESEPPTFQSGALRAGPRHPAAQSWDSPENIVNLRARDAAPVRTSPRPAGPPLEGGRVSEHRV